MLAGENGDLTLVVNSCLCCGTVEALVPTDSGIVACRIPAGGREWWCECRPSQPLDRPRPADCCPHLYALGSLPKGPR